MIEIIPIIAKWLSLAMFIFIAFILCKQLYENYKGNDLQTIKNKKIKKPILTFFLIFFVAIISRYLLYFIIYIFIYNPVEPSSFFDAINRMFMRSDAPHYIDIAKDFYVTSGDERFYIVFLPLYPFIINIVNVFINNYVFSAYLVSDICLGVGSYFLYLLAIPYIGEKGAKHSVLLFLLFPVSFFLGGAFTESMFIMLTAIFFYFLDKKRYFFAACIGFLAALTRNIGFLFIIPLIIKAFIDLKPYVTKKYNKFFWYSSYSLIILFGTGIYLLINELVTGNAFQFLVYAKEHWSQSIGFFPDSVSMLTMRIFADIPEYVYTLFLPEVISIFFVLAILCYGAKYLKPHYLAFTLVYFAVTIGATWLLSAPRYLMALLPIYIILGKIASEHKVAGITLYVFFSAALLYMTAAFSLGYYIY